MRRRCGRRAGRGRAPPRVRAASARRSTPPRRPRRESRCPPARRPGGTPPRPPRPPRGGCGRTRAPARCARFALARPAAPGPAPVAPAAGGRRRSDSRARTARASGTGRAPPPSFARESGSRSLSRRGSFQSKSQVPRVVPPGTSNPRSSQASCGGARPASARGGEQFRLVERFLHAAIVPARVPGGKPARPASAEALLPRGSGLCKVSAEVATTTTPLRAAGLLTRRVGHTCIGAAVQENRRADTQS